MSASALLLGDFDMKRTALLRLLLSTTAYVTLAKLGAAAQITTDGTTMTTCNGGGCSGAMGDITIDGGLIAGANQFHSFSDFNIATGGSANFTFSGAQTINNVIARVTGGNISVIDGGLSSDVPGADFFFINPAGITFNENASINVPAGLHLSTADQLVFDNGQVLAADLSSGSVFSSAAPEAFGFLGAGVGEIRFDGINTVLGSSETTISASDIDVSNDALLVVFEESSLASFNAVGGATTQLDFASGAADAALDGELTLSNNARILSSVQTGAGQTGADILLSAGRIFAEGSSNVSASSGDGGDGGSVVVNASMVELTTNSLFDTQSNNSTRGGDLIINATDILLDQTGGFSASVVNDSAGIGGDILIVSDTLRLTNGGGIEAIVFTESGEGTGGSITINSSLVEIRDGSAINVGTFPGSTGSAGAITITAESLALFGESIIPDIDASRINAFTFGSGTGANVVLNIADQLLLDDGARIDATTFGTGSGGTVLINAPTADIRLLNGGFISTGSDPTFGGFLPSEGGAAGSIEIVADTFTASGSFEGVGGGIGAGTHSDQVGGSISLTARRVEFRDGASINSASVGGSGNSGDITLNVSDSLILANDGTIDTTTFGTGDAGSITINAANADVSLSGVSNIESDNNAFLGTTPADLGAPGSITINADTFSVSDDTSVSVVNNSASDGGSIEVNARTLTLTDASTFTGLATPGSTGVSGDITLNVAESVLVENSSIEVQTQGSGDAGSILINAPTASVTLNNAFIPSSADGEFTVDGVVGSAGSITIVGDTISVNNSLITSEARSPTGNASAGTVRFEFGSLFEAQGTNIQSALSAIDFPGLDTAPMGSAGGVQFIGQQSNSQFIFNNSAVGAQTTSANPNAVGGAVTIDAGSVLLERSSIDASTSGASDGGSISISADSVLLSENSSISSVTEGAASGDGGNIEITAGTITLDESGVSVTTDGAGDGGLLTINVGESLMLDSGVIDTTTFGEGNAGTITINADGANVSLANGALVISNSATAEGNGSEELGSPGSIVLSADTLSIIGAEEQNAAGSFGGILANNNGDLVGGSITVSAREALLSNQGEISATTGIGAGNAGTVTVRTTEALILDGSAISTTSFSSADQPGLAGEIDINSGGTILLINGASIGSAAEASNAGSIVLTAVGEIGLFSGSSVTTNSADAEAGSITFNLGESQFLILNNSQITTSGTLDAEGQATGGEIIVQPINPSDAIGGAVLLSASTLEALGDGDGALLDIDGSGVLIVSTDSTIAVAGTVSTPDTEIVEDNEDLAEEFLNAGDVLATQCAAQQSGDGSVLAYNENIGLRAEGDIKPSPLRGPVLYGETESVDAVKRFSLLRTTDRAGLDCG